MTVTYPDAVICHRMTDFLALELGGRQQHYDDMHAVLPLQKRVSNGEIVGLQASRHLNGFILEPADEIIDSARAGNLAAWSGRQKVADRLEGVLLDNMAKEAHEGVLQTRPFVVFGIGEYLIICLSGAESRSHVEQMSDVGVKPRFVIRVCVVSGGPEGADETPDIQQKTVTRVVIASETEGE